MGESVPPFFIRQCLNVWKKLSLAKKEQFASYMQVVMSYYDRDWERETNPHLENKTIRRPSTFQYLKSSCANQFLSKYQLIQKWIVRNSYVYVIRNNGKRIYIYIYISVLFWSFKFYLITSEYTDIIKVIWFYSPS